MAEFIELTNKPPVNEEWPIVRLILDGTVVRVRIDRKATSISLSSLSVCARTARRYCSRSRAHVDPRLSGVPGQDCTAAQSTPAKDLGL
jgi:hypothetical protein